MPGSSIVPFIITASLLTVIGLLFLILVLFRVKSLQFQQHRLHLTQLLAEKDLMLVKASREVHDNLKPLVSLLRMNLHQVLKEAPLQSRELVGKTGEITDMLLREMDDISLFLDGRKIPGFGLMASIGRLVEWMNNSKKIKCEMYVEGTWIMEHAHTGDMVYRIVQEAIQNVIKHAHARLLKLSFTNDGQVFYMSVRDDGVGFDRDHSGFKPGFGFMSMRQRAKVLQGQLEIESKPGVGTIVRLSWRGKLRSKV